MAVGVFDYSWGERPTSSNQKLDDPLSGRFYLSENKKYIPVIPLVGKLSVDFSSDKSVKEILFPH